MPDTDSSNAAFSAQLAADSAAAAVAAKTRSEDILYDMSTKIDRIEGILDGAVDATSTAQELLDQATELVDQINATATQVENDRVATQTAKTLAQTAATNAATSLTQVTTLSQQAEASKNAAAASATEAAAIALAASTQTTYSAPIAGNYTVTNADNGKVLVFTGPDTHYVTLPAASTATVTMPSLITVGVQLGIFRAPQCGPVVILNLVSGGVSNILDHTGLDINGRARLSALPALTGVNGGVAFWQFEGETIR